MVKKYTPGSFTKNFSWNDSYKPLHGAIRAGFSSSSSLEPVTRVKWRSDSGIGDKDRELIPMNFFLYSVPGTEEDYLLIDQLVATAKFDYNQEFARLALFAFHMSKSGRWRHSKWPDGRVAGWANEFIRSAWARDDWVQEEFSDARLLTFIKRHVEAEEKTQQKVFTNYRYMLKSAGVLDNERLQPNNLRQRWLIDAVLLFWDREIFEGTLSASSNLRILENALLDSEIYKLLRCSKEQCQAFARAAFAEFAGPDRLRQLQQLKDVGAIAA
jgi:hypothetical protein